MTEHKPPRPIRRWKTRRDDKRVKMVRDYDSLTTLEIVYSTAFHKCVGDDCPKHGVIGLHDFYVKVFLHDDEHTRWVNGRRIPEVREYHRGCVPIHLKEAAELLDA